MKSLQQQSDSLIRIKTRALLSITLVCCLSLLSIGCEEEGVCEIKIEISSGNLYSCREGNTSESCNDSSGVERVFHEGKSCVSLGYPYKSNTGAFTAEPDDLKTPGDNGAFQNDTNNPGGSGGVAGCDGYNGPTFDIQIDSQCQAAYAYTCSGSADGVKATCAIYKSFQKDNPKIPNCPYCK